MKSLLTMRMLILQFVVFLYAVKAGPIVISANEESATEDFTTDEEDDDFTTATVERLSSAATCLVAAVEYTHGQQIYRADPCEFCLCLDGEMFCWWQDCPPAMEGPCKDKRPFTSCQNSADGTQERNTFQNLEKTTARNAVNSTTLSSKIIDNNINTSTLKSDLVEHTSSVISSSSTDLLMSTVSPKLCTIMGHKYNIGERLPHTTGNCVECTCGAGAQIICSPHQCSPPSYGEDINDYRPAGLRSRQPDVF